MLTQSTCVNAEPTVDNAEPKVGTATQTQLACGPQQQHGEIDHKHTPAHVA